MWRSLKLQLYGWLGTGWIAGWRRALIASLGHWEKGQIVFVSFLLVVLIFVGSFAYFAFSIHVRIAEERQRRADLSCLARNVYFEARGEPFAGQRAVAEVTMNRVASRRFPDTVCQVVHEKRWDLRRNRYVGAFSWTELGKMPRPKGIAWNRAVAAAELVYDAQDAYTVQGALFYHADIVEPSWARSQNRVAKIGRHIFYE
ncbi:MAG: cell wall hydrolase [Woeseia sp.]